MNPSPWVTVARLRPSAVEVSYLAEDLQRPQERARLRLFLEGRARHSLMSRRCLFLE